MKSTKLPCVLLGHGIMLGMIVLTMMVAHAYGPSPTDQYLPERCTRYCHDHGCPHLKSAWIKEAVTAQMDWLKNNPLGMDYRTINLLLYVLLLPGLILFLSIRLFLKIRW